MLRRFLQKQLEAVAHGKDPAGVSFDPAAPPVHYSAGNFLEESGSTKAAQSLLKEIHP